MADDNPDGGFGRAVSRGILFGIPVGVVLMVLTFWVATGYDVAAALRGGLLPGVLLGTFAGGFVGVVAATKH